MPATATAIPAMHSLVTILIYRMKGIYRVIFFCLITATANAGKRYTRDANGGDITIGNNSTSPALQPGDTFFIRANGRYTSVQYRHFTGDSSGKICVYGYPAAR